MELNDNDFLSPEDSAMASQRNSLTIPKSGYDENHTRYRPKSLDLTTFQDHASHLETDSLTGENQLAQSCHEEIKISVSSTTTSPEDRADNEEISGGQKYASWRSRSVRASSMFSIRRRKSSSQTPKSPGPGTREPGPVNWSRKSSRSSRKSSSTEGPDSHPEYLMQFCTGPAYLPALTCILDKKNGQADTPGDGAKEDEKGRFREESKMVEHQRTFLAVKPDAVQRGLVGNVISRFEQKGFKLVGMKMLVASRDLLHKHYAEHVGKKFFEPLVNYMSSGPVVAMVWEGKDVISASRTIVGATNPLAAAPGTIRGDYAIDVGRNIVHGSDAPESAQREINLWFTKEEQSSWQRDTDKWIYE